MTDVILVLNSGSSSLKFALFTTGAETPFISGLAERLGEPEACLHIKQNGEKNTLSIPSGDHHAALECLMENLQTHLQGLKGVGHRVVHGGEAFKGSCLITSETLDSIRACIPLAPLHNPANIQGIETAMSLFSGIPQVAVFDTAFHQNMPEHAYLYALPYHLYQERGIRRYGFHGTSHAYVTQQAAALLDKPFNESSWISAHLGNGCSVAAVENGTSIDTSMGMTPLEGLVMGTRSGDIDPGIPNYLHEAGGYDHQQLNNLLNKESGLLGLSELSNDCRTLEEAAQQGHEGAARALDVFSYRLAKTIGSYAVALEACDGLIFTGGIGEHSSLIRSTVLKKLGILGFELDENLNNRHGNEQGIITTPNSRPALVIPTNEELMIAQDTLELIG